MDEPRRGRNIIPALLIIGMIIIIIVLIVIIVLEFRKGTTPQVTLCTTDAACGTGRRCVSGQCIECSSNSDCSGGKLCIDHVCADCSPPSIPTAVQATYDSPTFTATISWKASPGATSYNVYRKEHNDLISSNQSDTNNIDGVAYTEKKTVTDPTAVFSALNPDTAHYFRVTSVNNCGESLLSAIVSVQTCTNVPAAPASPQISPSSNTCSSFQGAESVFFFMGSANMPGTAQILHGNNQHGIVSDYYELLPDNGSNNIIITDNIALKCNGQVSSHTSQRIGSFQNAVINSSIPVSSTATTYRLSWTPIPDAESYFYYVVGKETPSNKLRHYGGFVPADSNFITFTVNPDDTFLSQVVIGYKFCDVSVPSPPTFFTSHT